MAMKYLPVAWHIIEKSLATGGGIVNPRVMTGKAITPPPMDVIPPAVAPNTVMIDNLYRLLNSTKTLCLMQMLSQTNQKKMQGMAIPIHLL